MSIESEKARLLTLAERTATSPALLDTFPDIPVTLNNLAALVRAMAEEITHLKSVEKNLSDELTAEQEENEGWEAENGKLRARIAELEDQLHAARSKYE